MSKIEGGKERTGKKEDEGEEDELKEQGKVEDAKCGPSLVVKLPHYQMQEEVHVDSELSVKKVQKLRVVELGLQQVIQRYLRAGPRNHHRTTAPVDGKDTHFVTRNGQVDPVPLAFRVALPVHENPLVGEVPG